MSQGYIVDDLPRLRMLFIGVLTGIGVSSFYGFSMFTEHMKEKYDFTQGDITAISTVGCCFTFVVFFTGMLFDYAGPKVVLPMAGLLVFTGYLLVALSFNDVITASDKSTMKILLCIFNAMLFYGAGSLDIGTLMPLMLNFPADRGLMVMIQKAFCGLGTSILVALFNAWFRNVDNSSKTNYAAYALFTGIFSLSVGCVGGYLIDLPPYFPCEFRRRRLNADQIAERKATLEAYMHQNAPRRRLYIAFALVAIILVFLTTTSIVTGYNHTTQTTYHVIAIVVVIILASFGVITLPFECIGPYTRAPPNAPFMIDTSRTTTLRTSIDDNECDDTKDATLIKKAHYSVDTMRGTKSTCPDSDDVNDNIDTHDCDNVLSTQDQSRYAAHSDSLANTDDVKILPDAQPKETVVSSVGQPQIQGSFWSHLLTIDLWLLWLSFFGVWGTGTTMTMNAAQLYRSKNNGDYSVSVNGLYVAIISVGSALGRISSGVIDLVLTRYKAKGKSVPLITAFFPLGSLLLLLAFLFFAVLPAKYLIVPFFFGAAGNGIGWGMGALLMRIIYAEDIGKHYNFMFSAGFVSMIVLNSLMFGGMFDKKANEYETSPFCNHPDCIQSQTFILFAVNVVTTATAIAVHFRYRMFLRREKAKMFLVSI